MGNVKRADYRGVLTPREFVVLQLVASGLEKAEIAERLNRTTYTVRSQVASLRRKLGARNCAQAVAIAYERGYLAEDKTPASNSGDRPVVLMLTYEAIAIAQGDEMGVRMADGTDVLVRLYSAEEWLPLQHAAVDKHNPGGDKVSMARAVELTKPLPKGGA